MLFSGLFALAVLRWLEWLFTRKPAHVGLPRA